MLTLKCQHCGSKFQSNRRSRFCSKRCEYFGDKISAYLKWKPATYDYIPNACDMRTLILQQGDTW